MSEFYDEYTDDEVDLIDEIEFTNKEKKLNDMLDKYNINIDSGKKFIEKRCYDNIENNLIKNYTINNQINNQIKN